MPSKSRSNSKFDFGIVGGIRDVFTVFTALSESIESESELFEEYSDSELDWIRNALVNCKYAISFTNLWFYLVKLANMRDL